MSDDITTRLRRDCMSLIADEAADTIERLRADVMCLKYQNAEFVRNLTMAQDERNAAAAERDEARRDAERWRVESQNAYELTKTLTAERDEARRDAERWEDDALRLLNERNAAERERDEAQRECCVRTVDAGGNPAHAPLEEAIAEAKRRGWKCYRTAEDA